MKRGWWSARKELVSRKEIQWRNNSPLDSQGASEESDGEILVKKARERDLQIHEEEDVALPLLFKKTEDIIDSSATLTDIELGDRDPHDSTISTEVILNIYYFAC
ncbi:uncharacterized protein LOC129800018 [Phlebotomus papatasi]|uniref:uncharacterized protein LOC129800018 n=1 Tax=Phlebotomus papatasi TaxID=29031 RepID=UPI002483F5E3|nr:uncharacterized protein LOC129800018 [Phlebotomus papatasi]